MLAMDKILCTGWTARATESVGSWSRKFVDDVYMVLEPATGARE